MNEGASNTQKVIKGLSSQTIVTILLGVEGILYFSIMSRLLSREDFGLFAAVMAVTTIFSSFSDAGIGSALIQRKDMSEDYKNTAFTLSIVIGSFVSVVLVLLSGLIAQAVVGSHLKIPLMIMAVTIFLNGMVSVNFSWMRRYLHFLKVGVIMLVAHVISSVIAIAMAVIGYGLYAIIAKVVIASLLTLLISFFYINTRFQICLKKVYVKSILNFGGWLTASVVLNNISSQVDRLLMSRLLSVEALGAYNRPKEFILQISTRVNGVFDTALFPVLSSIQDNTDSLKNAFKRSSYYLNLCSMGLALFFICNSELLIRVFFGEEWLDLKTLFQLISITLVFNINGRLGDCYLRSMGLVRQQFNLRAFELLLNVICILIGSRLGVMGVASGFLIANITVIIMKILYLAKKLSVSQTEITSFMISGWGYGFYYVPLILLQFFLIPNTWGGGCLSLFFFIAITICVFLVFPKLIGRLYYEDCFVIVKANLKQKFKYFS